MRFADGPLTRAWRHGCVFLVNEMSAAPPDLWLSVNELLEGSPLYIPETGEVIHPHPRTRIVMTDNLRGLTEDYGSRYVGRIRRCSTAFGKCAWTTWAKRPKFLY